MNAGAVVTRVRKPAALREIRKSIAERVRLVGRSVDDRRRANSVALRELEAGRSPAVAYALALGAVTGRRNLLLASNGQVPACTRPPLPRPWICWASRSPAVNRRRPSIATPAPPPIAPRARSM